VPFERVTPFSPSMTRSETRTPRGRGLRSLTAALRRGARAPGNPALQTQKVRVMNTLYVRDQSGFREAEAADVLDRAQALLAQRYRVGSPVLTSPALTREFLRIHLGACEQEIFGVLHLDSRHRLIAVENLFRGTISSASVHPQEVVTATLRHNAAAVVFYHNQTSGLSEPSTADELIARRLSEALALIDVRVFDHLIISRSTRRSTHACGLFCPVPNKIATALGYTFTVATLKSEFCFLVMGSTLENDQTAIRDGLAKILSGKAALALNVQKFPGDPEAQAALKAILKGKAAIKRKTEGGGRDGGGTRRDGAHAAPGTR